MAKPQPPLRNLYPRLTSFSTLLAAFRKASKGKRYRPDVLTFAANLEAELFQLQHELRSFSYAPGPYRQFLVREPKPRLVSAAHFRDRLVHHALIAVIAPPLERHLVPTSYANRRGYGSHRALRRFARGLRWLPFTGQVGPLKSLTLDGWDRVRPQYRPLEEFCLPGSYGVLHGNTSRGSGPG